MGEKPTKKGIAASLAMRIFFVNIVILVLPLLIHSIISYRHEYRIRMRDAFHSLRIIGFNRQKLIEDLFHYQETVLAVVEKEVGGWDSGVGAFSFREKQAYLESVTEKVGEQNLFYITQNPKGQLQCEAYAKSCEIDSARLEGYWGKNRFYYTRFIPFQGKALFYVGITIWDSSRTHPKGLLIISNTAEKLVRGFAKLDVNSPLTLSFVSEGNKIIASSNAKLQGMHIDKKKYQ